MSVAIASCFQLYPENHTATSAANVRQCSGEEDPTCSDSIPSTGINLAHITYFGQSMLFLASTDEPTDFSAIDMALDPTLCF